MMKRTPFNLIHLMTCAVLSIILLYPDASPAQTCDPWAAKVVSVQGTVEVKQVGETGWQQAKLNDTYCPGDVIRVEENSRADIALVNQPVLRLDQNTTITLGGMADERTSLIDMLKGAAHFFSRAPKSLEVRTAFVNAGVEGTEFFIKVDEDRTFLTIFEGKVLAKNEAGSVGITGGQSAVAEKGKAPVLTVVAKPRDAVHWALYYPPIKYVPAEGVEIREDTSDPSFLAHRASGLLSVGRVDEANADIEKALSLDANYSDAYALQSIIAVVQNDKEKALTLANKAVETAPTSATAKIALSYAQQANFNLEGARASLEEAVKAEPENALAWARLAEMYSSFGNLDDSLGAAQRAVQLNPELARTQTVLGFAYLMQVRTDYAKAAFEEAIKFDQADPLPRLGLGLAKIREGDLQAGGREIEIAASLDPNNSLIRSYLGKVYYEEKRGKIDGEEYAIAKELDPKDPTPWFYDAIAKQTTNRPVEALQDIQKAIELNDNRAVYRSKLLLDSDVAARSASLARIYSDLGFQQRALVEGWNSVNTDPTNFSAHRFLADSYSALPRHEIARVSELLQSQLLQPNNITSIQPRLAESNLFLISSGGAADLSFNEFNPLFNRDQVTLQASGLAGEDSTYGGEGVLSGIYKKASYSLGYSKFKTDGWRENADQDDDIANVFLQLELTPKTSIQAEYRYRDTERGDTLLLFDNNDFAPDLRYKEETDTYRFGFHHSFSPISDLIGNIAFQNSDPHQSNIYLLDPALADLPPPPIDDIFNYDQDQDSQNGELQYLFRSKYVNAVAGGGYFNIDEKITSIDEFYWPGESPPLWLDTWSDKIDLEIDHYNLYLYSYINFPTDVTLTIGASGDFFEREELQGDRDLEEDQFNPKFGITWNPVPNTTIRGAVFRTLKRTLITDQTLEPTQVAGFNQFYDDLDASSAWVYGAAIDQKFKNNIYGGAEYVYRDLDVPVFKQSETTFDWYLDQADSQEDLSRVYIYWTPQKWLALTAEYQYEKFKTGETRYWDNVKTHRVPLGIKFFHPSGFSAGIKTTYVDQEGDFDKVGGGPVFIHGSDDFWVVDASITYRLPKRFGFIGIGVKNLFDDSFSYVNPDVNNPTILPARTIFGKITLAFP